MARLTERYESGGTAMIKGCGDNCKYGCKHCTQGGDIGDCGTIDDVVDKLADYEDAEEQGLLLKLPCKAGDTVYLIAHITCENRKRHPLKCIIDELIIENSNCYAVLSAFTMRRFKAINIREFGLTVFLTQEEAEKALADMKGE